MNEKDKLRTELSNYHVEYRCRWCNAQVLERELDDHVKTCKE